MRGEFYGRAYNLSSISIRSFKNETNVLTENGHEKQKRIRKSEQASSNIVTAGHQIKRQPAACILFPVAWLLSWTHHPESRWHDGYALRLISGGPCISMESTTDHEFGVPAMATKYRLHQLPYFQINGFGQCFDFGKDGVFYPTVATLPGAIRQTAAPFSHQHHPASYGRIIPAQGSAYR